VLRFVPFLPEHVDGLMLQPAQAEVRRVLTDRVQLEALRWKGIAESAIAEDGRVAGCAGLWHHWAGRAEAWALVGRTQPMEWLAIARRMATMLAAAERNGVWRIESHADAGFAPACRLLELLGFERKVLDERWSPEGRDNFLYVRLREAR
jgi:hypothetical protein